MAGVLEIAKAFKNSPQPPARSIYFAFVTAEESGLLGSSFLAANPPLPMDKVAANINVDGVKVPVVVRLEGTNAEKAREMLAASGLEVTAAADLTDAAQKAVAAAR